MKSLMTLTYDEMHFVLTWLYQKYDHSKLVDIERILTKYSGFESELLKKIAYKYNVQNYETLISELLEVRREEQKRIEKIKRQRFFVILISLLALLLILVMVGRNLHLKKQDQTSGKVLQNVESFVKLDLKKQRKPILNALRAPIQNELKQNVKFVVQKLAVCQNWSIVYAKPVQENGAPVDYSKTKHQKWINAGMFDNSIQALLEYNGREWIVVEYIIGATDTPVLEWIEAHNLSDCSGWTSK